MKQLSLRYEDKDYRKLKTAKKKTDLTWERFFLSLVTKDEEDIAKPNPNYKVEQRIKLKNLKGGIENE